MPGESDYSDLLTELSSPRFRELRPAQALVLGAYRSHYTTGRDIAVELPTGSGKSLLALLIGEAWRREGKKVAVLTGNKTLARQMKTEADLLGISSELMEGSRFDIPTAARRRYQRSQAVAIMNYWVYFNQNPVVDRADLLIMDDAHLAEHALHSLYSVEIDRFKHESLFDALVVELAARFPEYSVLQDALDDEAPLTSAPELLSFFDQCAVVDRIREIVDASPELEQDKDLSFRWSRLRNRLNELNVYMSARSLWMKPDIYPLIRNDYYESADQCIYMSATIGDTGDLARRLGTRQIEKIPIDGGEGQATYGRRMIVINKSDDSDIPARLSTAIRAGLEVHAKSVWLCASKTEAEHFRDTVKVWLNSNGFVGHPTWILSSLGSEIDEFKAAPKGHLFVAGRFDGMDFEGDECRLVVVATLPRAINIQEEFMSAYLRDADFMRWRLNQRIIQALGRCNRSADDYGVYVLADRRFVTHFGRDANRVGIPPNIQAEIDYAEDWAERDETDLADEVTKFLSGDFTTFDAALANNTQAGPTVVAIEPTITGDEVEGWAELFESQDYPAAHDHFEECCERPDVATRKELGAFFRWHQAKAAFLAGQQGDAKAAAAAVALAGSAIDWGGRSSWFNRLRASLNRHLKAPPTTAAALEYSEVLLHAFDDNLERLGTTGSKFQRWIEQTRAQLQSGVHSDFELGLQELGRILGYSAIRPHYQGATDNRWRGVFGNVREVVVFEAKIEQGAAARIASSHIGQAHNQLARAETQYGNRGFMIRGTIVTHRQAIELDAEQELGAIRVLRKDAVIALFERVASLMAEYRSAWSLHDVSARLQAAQLVAPKMPKSGWLTRALSTDEHFCDETTLLSEWP